jgi:NAD(P)-dependent dehydrogenase (short-subunit alcohol dehydrogenase family)
LTILITGATGNVASSAICLGFFKTRLAEGAIAALGEQRTTSRSPLRRLGDEGALKGLALLLSSDAGEHITGRPVAVDGGTSAVLSG